MGTEEATTSLKGWNMPARVLQRWILRIMNEAEARGDHSPPDRGKQGIEMPTCQCNGQCKLQPYTCSGLTHESGWPAQMRYNWGYQPWVFESWAKYSQQTGADKRAQTVRDNILNAIRDHNATKDKP